MLRPGYNPLTGQAASPQGRQVTPATVGGSGPPPAAPSDGAPAPKLALDSGISITPEMTDISKDMEAERLIFSTGVTGDKLDVPMAAGSKGVDLRRTISKAQRYILRKNMREAIKNNDGAPLTDEQMQRLRIDAYNQAEQEVNSAFARARGIRQGPLSGTGAVGDRLPPNVPIIDLDPKRYHEGLRLWARGEIDAGDATDYLPTAAREAIAPLIAMWGGTSIDVRAGSAVRSYNEGLNWGGLDWLGRLSPATAFSQYIAAPGDLDWGGDEHLRTIQRGDDYFSLWDDIEALADDESKSLPRQAVGAAAQAMSTPWESMFKGVDKALEATIGVDLLSEKGAEKAGDFVTAMTLAFVDPDITQVIIPALGAAPIRKGLEVASDGMAILRHKHKANLLRETRDLVAARANRDIVSDEQYQDLLQNLYQRAEAEVGPAFVEVLQRHIMTATVQAPPARVVETLAEQRDFAAQARARVLAEQSARIDALEQAKQEPFKLPAEWKVEVDAAKEREELLRAKRKKAATAVREAAETLAKEDTPANVQALASAREKLTRRTQKLVNAQAETAALRRKRDLDNALSAERKMGSAKDHARKVAADAHDALAQAEKIRKAAAANKLKTEKGLEAAIATRAAAEKTVRALKAKAKRAAAKAAPAVDEVAKKAPTLEEVEAARDAFRAKENEMIKLLQAGKPTDDVVDEAAVLRAEWLSKRSAMEAAAKAKKAPPPAKAKKKSLAPTPLDEEVVKAAAELKQAQVNVRVARAAATTAVRDLRVATKAETKAVKAGKVAVDRFNSAKVRNVKPVEVAAEVEVHTRRTLLQAAMLADAKSLLASISLVQQSGKRTTLVKDAAGQPEATPLATGVIEALVRLQRATESGDYKGVRKASADLGELAVKAGKSEETNVIRVLEERVKIMEGDLADSLEYMDSLGKTYKRRFGKKKWATHRAKLDKTIKNLNTASSKTAGHRGSLALVAALDKLAGTFDLAAKNSMHLGTPAQKALMGTLEREMRQTGGATLARNPINRALQYWSALVPAAKTSEASGIYSVTENHLRALVQSVKLQVDPGEVVWGTRDAAIQSIAKGSENFVRAHSTALVEEAIREGSGAATDATRTAREAGAMMDYVGTHRPDKFLTHSSTDESLWDYASPILRAVSGTRGEAEGRGASETERIFSALSRMWVKGGVKGGTSVKQLEKLRKAAKLLMAGYETTDADGNTFRVYPTFQEFVLGMRVQTARIQNNRRPGAAKDVLQAMEAAAAPDPEEMAELGRATAFAVKAVLEAGAIRKSSDALAGHLGELPEATLQALTGMRAGEEAAAGALLEAAEIFTDRLGMPVYLKEQTRRMASDVKGGFELLNDRTNKARFFVPRRWMQRIDDMSNVIVKSGLAYEADEADPLAAKATRVFGTALRSWNMAILAGYAMGNPRYFATMLFGNLSQIYNEQGLGAAGKAATGSVVDVIDGAGAAFPFVRRYTRGRVPEALASLEKSLPSAIRSAFSLSTSAFFDPAIGKANGVVKGPDGKTYTWAQLRRMAMDLGVLETFAASSGMHQLASRAPKYRVGGVWKELTEGWSEMANAIEQRQRVSLFLNKVVNEGKTPGEAAEIVKHALYDWSHPLSAFEEAYFKKVFMFWTFQRKALGQQMRHLLSPFSADASQTWDNPLSRQIRAARAMSGAQRMQTEYNAETYSDPYANIYPFWLSGSPSRMGLGNVPLSPDERRATKQQTGKDHTHRAYTFFSPTNIESMNLLWSGAGVLSLLARGEGRDAADQASQIVGGLVGPSTQPVIEHLRQQAGYEQAYRRNPRGAKVTSKFDQKVLQWMGLAHYDPREKAWFASPGAYTSYKALLPHISVNVAGNFEPFLVSGTTDRPLTHTMMHLMGLKTYTHSPKTTLKMDKAAIEEDVLQRLKAQQRATTR